MKAVKEADHWSSVAIRNKDVLGIMTNTMKKRNDCVTRKKYNLRVEAILKSTEISAITLMYLPNPQQHRKEEDRNAIQSPSRDNTLDNDDPFELDALFAKIDDAYKANVQS